MMSPLLSSFKLRTTPSLALLSCSPSYSAWLGFGSTGRERCASIVVAPHSEHTIARGAEEGAEGAHRSENLVSVAITEHDGPLPCCHRRW